MKPIIVNNGQKLKAKLDGTVTNGFDVTISFAASGADDFWENNVFRKINNTDELVLLENNDDEYNYVVAELTAYNNDDNPVNFKLIISDGSNEYNLGDVDVDGHTAIDLESLVAGTGGGSSTDEKVKADIDDPNAGYLSDKVDGDSLGVDTTNHIVKVNVDGNTIVTDTTNHNIKVKDGVFADKEHTHTSADITDFDEAAQDAVGGILTDSSTVDFTYDDDNNKITADVISDSVVEKVEVAKNGTLTGTRKQINFVEGSNITLTVTDDDTNNKVDVKIDAAAGGDTGSNPVYRTFIAGEQSVGVVDRFVAKGTQQLQGVKISLATLPQGSDFKVQVTKNGTDDSNSIFTDDQPIVITTDQPATNGIYISTKTDIDNGSLVENDVLYFKITQVGSDASGTDLEIEAY